MSRSWLIVPLLLLYLLHLGGVGFLGPDEPRYASIGREMARTGDWITPRLNAQPWFEKPPLTYWLTALGHLARLPDEWAARFPEALISVAFLIFFYRDPSARILPAPGVSRDVHPSHIRRLDGLQFRRPNRPAHVRRPRRRHANRSL